MGFLDFLKYTLPSPKIIKGKIIGIEQWGDYEILVTFEDGLTTVLSSRHTTAVKHYMDKFVTMVVSYDALEKIEGTQSEFKPKEEATA